MKKDPGEDQPACLLICMDSISITAISYTEVKIALMKYSNWILGRHSFTQGHGHCKEREILAGSLCFKRGAREGDEMLWCLVVCFVFGFFLNFFSIEKLHLENVFT